MIKKALRALVPNPGTLIVLGLFLWAQAVGAVPGKAPATQNTTIPRLISYQGRLTNAMGEPVANGNYRMVFSLYCTQTGGEAFWFEDRDATNKVPVSDGFFNVLLGQLTPLPTSFDCPDGNVYLGIRVDPDPTEMDPRELLASVPYAFQAVEVPDGSITTEKIADEAVTQAKLGADVSLVPPDGSITTEKLADRSVTSQKIAPTVKRAGASNEIDRAGSEWTDLEDVSISLSASEVPVTSTLLISFWCEHRRSAYGRQENYFRILVDGNQVGFGASGWSEISGDSGWRFSNLAMFEVADVSVGAHTVKVQRYHPGGGARFKERVLTVMVVAQQQQ